MMRPLRLMFKPSIGQKKKKEKSLTHTCSHQVFKIHHQVLSFSIFKTDTWIVHGDFTEQS